jgi:hypothetical protein
VFSLRQSIALTVPNSLSSWPAFGAELCPRDRPADHERSRRADLDGIEVLQLFSERRRSERPVTANVDASQKNHRRHAFLMPSVC